jgi:hypothetical protein
MTTDHRAQQILEAIPGRADCGGQTTEGVILTAVVPPELLDDAFALVGAVEDLEDGHDAERDDADWEPCLGWSNPGYAEALSWRDTGMHFGGDGEV